MPQSVEKILFAAASSLSEGERRLFLDYSCRADPSLRKSIEELLAIQSEADTFFELRPGAMPQAETGGGPTNQPEAIGTRIGRYRLVARIGAGGCGVVYDAQQEEPVRRRVALKIVKLGMDTEAVIARFEMERQALAQMEHPNIAKVLDAGATASGRPYFVMELVEGEKITEFCDKNRLTIQQRLLLFVQVCQAVQHAHQKGVIHRDIKPSNILANWNSDHEPVPKVIDFGISKATAPAGDRNTTLLGADQLLGTPDYMSPEQAEGNADVDTRSDIYSLGVLLYELLCSRTPFALSLQDCPAEEVRRVIREEESKTLPESLRLRSAEEQTSIAANRGTDFPHLLAQVRGDLEWIVLKAMEKERSERYATALDLGSDVLRHLNNQVVHARPPSRTYRLGKLIARNKLLFAAGSVALFSLVAGLGTSTWMFFRERTALQEQTKLREKAENLRREAEIREQIAHAAVKIKYGDLDGAEKILAGIPRDQTPSSLEAAQVYDAVAHWHIKEGRLKEAAARKGSAAIALLGVDDSSLNQMVYAILPAATMVAHLGEPEQYEQIRRLVNARFASTADPVTAEQSLKVCLLRPAGPEMLQSVKPFVRLLENTMETRQGAVGNDPLQKAWACFALSTFYYRTGDYVRAADWAERCLASPDKNEPRDASILSVRAMIEYKTGQFEKARVSLGLARTGVQAAFASNAWLHPGGKTFYFDWINASRFRSEAESTLAGRNTAN